MTEAEWYACPDPQPMLEFLRGKVSDRKLRLFAVACCLRIAHHPLEVMVDESWALRVRNAVVVAELYADGKATEEERNRARGIECSGIDVCYAFRNCSGDVEDLFSVLDNVNRAVAELAPRELLYEEAVQPELLAQSNLVRCILGSLPFRPAGLDLNSLTATVPALAQAIYADRAFDRLPILADALEDAGCHDTDILAHCRAPGPHVRGCWVVDLLTGRE